MKNRFLYKKQSKQERISCRKPWLIVTLYWIAAACAWYNWDAGSIEVTDSIAQLIVPDEQFQTQGPCAINLYGLPRKFKDLTLPSMIENVVKPNAIYQCDYFVHYYDRRFETLTRHIDKDREGVIDPGEVFLLEKAVRENHGPQYGGTVSFLSETEEEFQEQLKSVLVEIHTARGDDSELLYMPEPVIGLTNSSIENIVKMWHSQEAVWNLMVSEGERRSRKYSRIAMLRSDVFFATPIDIYRLPDGSMDYENKIAVVPDFANYPVNDRMMMGPFGAMKLWSASRFSLMSRHAQYLVDHDIRPRSGIHSEIFLFYTLFPAIKEGGYDIRKDRALCFLRVRPDSSVRFTDCGVETGTENNQEAVESIIGRTCNAYTRFKPEVILECGLEGAKAFTGTKKSWSDPTH